jgi:carboxypeptidase T
MEENQMLKQAFLLSLTLFAALPTALAAGAHEMQWAAIRARDNHVRTELVNQGFSVESVKNDISYGFAPIEIVQKLESKGYEVITHFPAKEMRALDYPKGDSVYHNYDRMNQELDALVAAYPGIARKFSIGKTGQGREMWGIRINPHAQDSLSPSGMPGIVFMGGHHAREHLSVEVPLLLARYLLENGAKDGTIQHLVDTRDIFIIPMVNPDGAEFDISTGDYQLWRKNRTQNPGQSSDCDGVDVNRNYGFAWGTGGSSTDPCSEVYMGPKAFSEPESQAVKAFVEGHPNLKELLTFHTYSELVLYPWGHTEDNISNQTDLAVFQKMAQTMAGWNGYTAEKTSDLYIASGDTTDWAYGALGVFAFTFEMSPNGDAGSNGFYPGPNEIQHSFQANLKPALYMIDLADDPHRAVKAPQTTLFYGR